ncbi:hypothetical protein MTO96_030818 [Rhipicephalus appendiculatus]
MDVHGPDKNWHTGGWAVRQLCSQPLDTLFFVHVAPSYWKTRIHLRATLFEEAARAAFNWTGVFFVAQDNNSLSNLWTNLEAELMGDVVVFPYNDSYFTTAYKFVRGMRWVNEYCPKVRHIVKIDHDVGVQPFELRRYLDRYLPLKDSSIHCNTLMYTAVFRYGRRPSLRPGGPACHGRLPALLFRFRHDHDDGHHEEAVQGLEVCQGLSDRRRLHSVLWSKRATRNSRNDE